MKGKTLIVAMGFFAEEKDSLVADAKAAGLSPTEYCKKLILERKESAETLSFIGRFDDFAHDQALFNKSLLEALKTPVRPPVTDSIRQHFKPRIHFKLSADGIRTLADLLNMDLSRLWRVPGIGKTAHKEIEDFLLKHKFIPEPIQKK